MQKLNTPEQRSTGLGTSLAAKLTRTGFAKVHDASPAPRLHPLFSGSLEPLFAQTAAANLAKAAAPKPVQTFGTKATPADTGAVRQHSEFVNI